MRSLAKRNERKCSSRDLIFFKVACNKQLIFFFTSLVYFFLFYFFANILSPATLFNKEISVISLHQASCFKFLKSMAICDFDNMSLYILQTWHKNYLNHWERLPLTTWINILVNSIFIWILSFMTCLVIININLLLLILVTIILIDVRRQCCPLWSLCGSIAL